MEMPRNTSVQAWLGDSFGNFYPYLQQDPLQAGLVQRLDVETSGPVVVATRPDTFRKMWQLRSAGHFYREYVVLLHGKLPIKHCYGTLDYNLNTRRRCSKVSERHGQPAKTRYQAIAAYTRKTSRDNPQSRTSNYTLLRVRILTGRLHQIRVHLREFARRLGLPVCGVVGDYKYLPRAELLKDREFCPRVFLHARVLRFPLPGKNRRLCRICCELPVDLMRVLRALTPHEELTAKLTKLGDFLLRGNDSEAPVPAIGDGVDIDEQKRGAGVRIGSRSPSHWRALPPGTETSGADLVKMVSPPQMPSRLVIYEQSEGTTREPSEDRFDASESALWSPELDQFRHRQHRSSPSPVRWCPPPCSPASSGHNGTGLDERSRSFSSSPSLTPGPSPGSTATREGSASASVSRGRGRKRSRNSGRAVRQKRSRRRGRSLSRSGSGIGSKSRGAPDMDSRVQSGVAPEAPQDQRQEKATHRANRQKQVQSQERKQEQVEDRKNAQRGGQERKHECEQRCGGRLEAATCIAPVNSCPQSEFHSALLATSFDGGNAAEGELSSAELPTEEVPSSSEFPEHAADSEAGVAGLPEPALHQLGACASTRHFDDALTPVPAESSMLEHDAVDPFKSHDRLLAINTTGEFGAAAAAEAAQAAAEVAAGAETEAVEALLDSSLQNSGRHLEAGCGQARCPSEGCDAQLLQKRKGSVRDHDVLLAASRDHLRERGVTGPEVCHSHEQSLAADSTSAVDLATAAATAAAAAEGAVTGAAGPQMHEEQEAHDLSVSGADHMEASQEQSPCPLSGSSLAARTEGASVNKSPKPQTPGIAAKRRKRAAKAAMQSVSRRWEDDPFGLWQS